MLKMHSIRTAQTLHNTGSNIFVYRCNTYTIHHNRYLLNRFTIDHAQLLCSYRQLFLRPQLVSHNNKNRDYLNYKHQ